MAENDPVVTGEVVEEVAEIAAEVAAEVATEVAAVVDDTPEVDVDVTVFEAPEPEEPESKFSTVDVGDLHISGPAKLVKTITEDYLKKHLDHNPHGENHTPDGENFLEESAAAITPDVVEEQIADAAAGDIVDNPPEPSDWLFRRRAGR